MGGDFYWKQAFYARWFNILIHIFERDWEVEETFTYLSHVLLIRDRQLHHDNDDEPGGSLVLDHWVCSVNNILERLSLFHIIK